MRRSSGDVGTLSARYAASRSAKAGMMTAAATTCDTMRTIFVDVSVAPAVSGAANDSTVRATVVTTNVRAGRLAQRASAIARTVPTAAQMRVAIANPPNGIGSAVLAPDEPTLSETSKALQIWAKSSAATAPGDAREHADPPQRHRGEARVRNASVGRRDGPDVGCGHAHGPAPSGGCVVLWKETGVCA